MGNGLLVSAHFESLSVCRICQTADVESVWQLKPTPYGDLYKESKFEAQSLPSHPLDLGICRQCGFLQLLGSVDAGEIYSEYLYQSSLTGGLPGYYSELASRLISTFNLSAADLVVDVGSNDGLALEPFLDAGIRVVGVEPSRSPAEVANMRGIPTINEFLNEKTCEQVLATFGEATLVCANFVAANVPDPVAFFKSLKAMLKPEGVISIVTGYHPDQFAIGMFEYINHDHLSYFTVHSATQLGEAVGLRLVSAQRVEHKGGSVHLLFSPVEASAQTYWSVPQLLQREEWLQANSPQSVSHLSRRVSEAETTFKEFLKGADVSRMAGIGASISVTHLMFQLGIGASIDRLFDDDLNKVGRYSPGLGIEVEPIQALSSGKWKTACLLAWQHEQSLLKRLESGGFRGTVVLPLPILRTMVI